ncbi:lactonase family protein [Gryllotalpicola reticulitermitis]|uniref:Lactonase family protein n=1 Tax=Gryllotalpicola reticulitermitis TaxID=1184153 RepID=A0ABV8Q729_9MICO
MASSSLLIGTYTDKLAHVDGKADGILRASYSEGGVGDAVVAAKITNPSWLCVTADGTNVYAVIETVEFDGAPGGGAAAYARDPRTGELTVLNEVPSDGVEPAHIALDPSEKFVLVGNYRTGSVSVFAREADGSLGARVDHVQHEGSSVHEVRQTGPHAHQILFDPKTGLALVPDLGLDAVLFYEFSADGKLSELSELRFSTAPGAGPRHLAFHPNGEYLFLITELDNTMIVLKRDGDGFVQNQIVSTLPADFTGHNQTSEVRVSHSGRFVFGSNRGHDSIAMFRFDEAAGTIELVHVEPSLGEEPRDFIQSPDGAYLLVANQNSDNIVTFAIDEDAANLTHVGTSDAATPVCVVFV